MVSPKKTNSSLTVSNADMTAATPLVIRPQHTAALIAKDKIRDLPKKLSDLSTYKIENAAKPEDNSNNTISSLPAKDKKVPSSTATTKPTQKGNAAGSPKCKADKTGKTAINDVPSESADQPTPPQAKYQKSPSASDQPSQDNVSHAGPSQLRNATTIWKSVRGQTAAEKCDLRKQQKEHVEKIEAQKKAEKQAEEKAKVQKKKMKFMIPSSDEAVRCSLTDEEDAEAEAYAKVVSARIKVMAGVYQSIERDGIITYKGQDQVMGGMIAKEAPQRTSTRTSSRKQSPKANIRNAAMGMDTGNEDVASRPYVDTPEHPRMSSKKNIVDDEEDEDEESPPHLRKPQRGRPKKGDKMSSAALLDEDDEECLHKRTWGRLRGPSAKAKAAVVEIEDDEDEVEESPPRNFHVSRVRQPKAAKGEARAAVDEDMEDVVQKSQPRTRAPRGHPPKAAKAKARVVESEDEDEDMEAIDKSPPRARGDHLAATAKRLKAKIGDAQRIDPYNEAALYTFFAGFSLNVPNKTRDKARMGEGMGHRKHK